MTRPSRACKIFLTPHPSQPQSSRPSGNGARGCCAWPRRSSGRMPRSSGRTRPCGTASPSSSGARRLTAPPAASRPPATACARRAEPRGAPEAQRGKSGRPSGGQPGHKGTTLARTESPDHVVDHDPSACSGCGAPLSDADRHRAPVCRQVFDVPEPRPLEVTEHRAHRCLCGACATVTGAVFPDGVTAPVQYGPRITAWVSYLLYAQFVPEKRLAELMSDLFAVSISTATITAMGWRTARRFEPFLAHVADVIRTAVPVQAPPTKPACGSPPVPAGSTCCAPHS